MSKLTPLRIDWTLSGHVVVPDRHPILLDALLLAGKGERLPLPFVASALPLQHIATSPEHFFWLASWVEIDFIGPAAYRQTFRNAKPLAMLESAKHLHASSVSFDRGITRTVKSTHLTRQATAARAWCMGDADALSQLLGHIHQLGARRHAASGQITSWQIEPDEQAIHKAWLRPIPAPHPHDPYSTQRIVMQGACVPPYWLKQLQGAYWPEFTHP